MLLEQPAADGGLGLALVSAAQRAALHEGKQHGRAEGSDAQQASKAEKERGGEGAAV